MRSVSVRGLSQCQENFQVADHSGKSGTNMIAINNGILTKAELNLPSMISLLSSVGYPGDGNWRQINYCNATTG